MVEFRESYGEFNPGCKRKTVKLEITEYDVGADKIKLTTKFGFYEGKPLPAYREFFKKLYLEAVNEPMKNERKRTSDQDTSV